MKRIIRNFILFIEQKTRKWVIPSSVWTKLDKGDISAKIHLSDIAVKWGILDPEFIRAKILLSRIEYYEKGRKIQERIAAKNIENRKISDDIKDRLKNIKY